LSKTHLNQIKKFENPKAKLHLVPHAYNVNSLISSLEKIQEMKDKYLIDTNQFNIMMNARWTKTKGVKDVIEAYRLFQTSYENSKLWLFHASGDFKNEIENNLKKLPENSFETIVFEENIMAVYPMMNVFVHVPQRATYESFGQVYIEAMGLGLPCIFTLSGIAEDIIIPNENALQVPYNSSGKILEALLLIKTDSQLTEKLQNNAEKITGQFLMEDHIKSLQLIYQ
jgi:glycosyltransferase involved in cell wall biosynthesis